MVNVININGFPCEANNFVFARSIDHRDLVNYNYGKII